MNKKKSLIKKGIGLMARIGKIICPPFDIFTINYLAAKNANIILRLKPTSFADYSKSSECKITIVEDEQERIVYQPEYFPCGEAKEYQFKSYSIYIAELKNVIVHGGSGLVIAGDKVLTDISENDVENRVKYRSGPIRRGNKKYFYIETSKDEDHLDVAINLCGLAARNYYHLTFELLSRFEYVKPFIGDKDIPVLLDESVRIFPQYIELIKTVLKDAKVIYVPECKKIRCKFLIQPSMNTWMPMNVRKKNDFRMADNIVAYSAVTNIRKAAEAYMLPKGDKKVFISREHAGFSRIVNEKEVAQLFKDNGYEVVCTEELTYRQQVELFSSATCIVGASGAALTNVVYCNSGTVFGCIMPRKYGFCSYSTIGYMNGCKELFIDARVPLPGLAISTEKCLVNLDDCKIYVEKLEEMINGKHEEDLYGIQGK